MAGLLTQPLNNIVSCSFPQPMVSSLIALLSLASAPDYEAAWKYAADNKTFGVLVQIDGKITFERYASGDRQTPHAMASGTKSFTGPLLAHMQSKGLLNFDEKASDTITEWRNDERRDITIRQLANLASGLQALENKTLKNTVQMALDCKLMHKPGEFFEYGPTSYLVLGEIATRKLKQSGITPYDYLQKNILAPIGMKARIGQNRDGSTNFAGGGNTSIGDWLKYGETLMAGGKYGGKQIIPTKDLAECFIPSKANPGYGSTFWLSSKRGVYPPNGMIKDRLPSDTFVAAGLGGQILVVIPSKKTIVIRMGTVLGETGFKIHEFLDHLAL